MTKNLGREKLALPKTGVLKFFNNKKGFGFIIPEGGGDDVFLHISELGIAGLFLPNGQKLKYKIGPGRNGDVMAVEVEIIVDDAPILSLVAGTDTAVRLKGKVKWFDEKEKFGFITPRNGDKDAFVHITAVKEAGLTTLAQKQKIEFDLVTEPDGRKSAQNLELID